MRCQTSRTGGWRTLGCWRTTQNFAIHDANWHSPCSECVIAPVLLRRAHLNEAPDEPHRRLADAGLLADNVIFEDPFVTLRGGGLWRDYMAQLRAAGAQIIDTTELSIAAQGSTVCREWPPLASASPCIRTSAVFNTDGALEECAGSPVRT